MTMAKQFLYMSCPITNKKKKKHRVRKRQDVKLKSTVNNAGKKKGEKYLKMKFNLTFILLSYFLCSTKTSLQR